MASFGNIGAKDKIRKHSEDSTGKSDNRGDLEVNNMEWDDSDDDDNEDDESVLSDISNESTYFNNKLIYQRRALFKKNITL